MRIKLEEWPSRAKWDQAGPNWAKWCQTGFKRGQEGPFGPNVAKRAKRGQMGSNGADFLRSRIFS